MRARHHVRLVLGNYRVLERLGAGGMAVVFKGEHMELRNQVAIKVLPISAGPRSALADRASPARCASSPGCGIPTSSRPWIAAGPISNDPQAPVLWYLVMEYVPGTDLEEYVQG